jgi:hypothetical protein
MINPLYKKLPMIYHTAFFNIITSKHDINFK